MQEYNESQVRRSRGKMSPRKRRRILELKCSRRALMIMAPLYLAMCLVLILPQRSTFSLIEMRTLTLAPDFTMGALMDGTYIQEVSHWFADAVPFYDDIKTLQITFLEMRGIGASGILEETVEEKLDVQPEEAGSPEEAAEEENSQETEAVSEGSESASEGEGSEAEQEE